MSQRQRTLVCDHSNESYWAVLLCGNFVMLYKVVLTLDETFVCALFTMLWKVVLILTSMCDQGGCNFHFRC